MAEAARLGAFLEAAEQYGKDHEDRDQQHDPQQAAPGPRARPAPAATRLVATPAPALAPIEQGPVHTRVYAQVRRNMPPAPNYLNPRG